MIKNSFLIILILAVSLLFSCKNDNAKAKVNQENVEKAKARDIEIKNNIATVTFDKSVYDFGTVNEGEVVKTTFVVTNTGTTDLIITNAQASCGCTVPTWPKNPIKPNSTGNIEVAFNTSGKPNKQSKTITLTTNTESGREVLTLKGSVIPKTN